MLGGLITTSIHMVQKYITLCRNLVKRITSYRDVVIMFQNHTCCEQKMTLCRDVIYRYIQMVVSCIYKFLNIMYLLHGCVKSPLLPLDSCTVSKTFCSVVCLAGRHTFVCLPWPNVRYDGGMVASTYRRTPGIYLFITSHVFISKKSDYMKAINTSLYIQQPDHQHKCGNSPSIRPEA